MSIEESIFLMGGYSKFIFFINNCEMIGDVLPIFGSAFH